MRELRGKPVLNSLMEQVSKQIEALKEKRIIPKLAVIRVGEREDDIAYEKGIIKCFSAANAAVDVKVLPVSVTQDVIEEMLINLNHDSSVHGILLFRPLPGELSQERLKELIAREKDVDGMGTFNNAYIYEGNKSGYAPCTAQAVMEMLDFYEIDPAGKKVTVIGRSQVVGKPLAMLLLGRNATVTVCHTKTIHIAEESKRADILIACAGSAKMAGIEFTNNEQIVIDVGINMVDGKLCGDVDYEAVAQNVAAITPGPGGVGTVTTAVLLKNTVNSAMHSGISLLF
jgi:methylenetetrahydrofolate dehydrogenase (NADP+)/methenyltetrahydrofolate cyclohydrolase